MNDTWAAAQATTETTEPAQRIGSTACMTRAPDSDCVYRAGTGNSVEAGLNEGDEMTAAGDRGDGVPGRNGTSSRSANRGRSMKSSQHVARDRDEEGGSWTKLLLRRRRTTKLGHQLGLRWRNRRRAAAAGAAGARADALKNEMMKRSERESQTDCCCCCCCCW